MQYAAYFVIGGALVTTVAYLGKTGNPILTILVANLPVLFLLNIYLCYKIGGVDSCLVYARGSLSLLPFYIAFVVLTMWLLPKIGLAAALVSGSSLYILPVFGKMLKRRRCTRSLPPEKEQPSDECALTQNVQ